MCKKYHDDEYTLITINKCKLHNLYYDSFYTKYKISLYSSETKKEAPETEASI